MRSPSPWVRIVLLGCFLSLASSAVAQVIHVPPVFRKSLPEDKIVLEIKMADFDSAVTQGSEGAAREEALERLRRTRFGVQDNQLVIATPGSGIETIPLSGRKMRDLIADLETRYEDSLVIISAYPLEDRLVLKSKDPVELSSGVKIEPNPNDPLVGLGFGVVFALSENDDADQSGLLSDAGFQLDLTGIHQLKSPGEDPNGFLPDWITAQARLGLNANQQLNVETRGPRAGPQFGAALEQADQVGVTAQLDLVFPIANRMDLVFTPVNYGISWTRLEAFEFPPVAVADTFVSSEVAFDTIPLRAALDAVERVLPLSEIGPQVLFQFRNEDVPVFYFGGSALWKEVAFRRVRFTQASPDSLPVRNSVTGELDNPMHFYWRAMLGARLAGVLDVRLDAAGPIGSRDGEPLLRLVLGHAFPVVSD